MEILTQSDYQLILEFLQLLYVPCSLDKFPRQILSGLSKLVGAEVFAITSFGIRDPVFSPRIYTFPHPEIGIAAESFTSQRRNFFAHPVSKHYAQTLDGQALAISDFFSELQFHRQDLLYTGFFRQFGLEDQMMIHFELPSIAQADPLHQGQHFVLSISRDRRNFTERDRLILNLIRPHLKQVYENQAAFNQLQNQFVQQQQATEQAALILISIDGKVKWMTQKAEKIIHSYFQPANTKSFLPDILQRWVNSQVFKLVQSTENLTSPCSLRLELDKQLLTVYLNYNSDLEQVYLLLEETQSIQFSIESLQMLGLTKREAEVLFWVAKNQTTTEVAKLLGISDRTVKKHLEHVYEKFGVQTRLAAVIYVLNHLGILA